MELFSVIWHSFVYVCLTVYPVIAAIFVVAISFKISGPFYNIRIKRERRQQAETVVNELVSEIKAVRVAYEGKYMPIALKAELKAAIEAMITLRIRSLRVNRLSEIVEVVDEGTSVLVGLRALSARQMTKVEHEANHLALVVELAQLEVNTEKEQAALEETYHRQLRLLLEKRDSERLRLAKWQELLAANAFI
jgi:hypothetical protein